MKITPDAVEIFARNLKVGMEVVGEGTVVKAEPFDNGRYVSVTYRYGNGDLYGNSGEERCFSHPATTLKKVIIG